MGVVHDRPQPDVGPKRGGQGTLPVEPTCKVYRHDVGADRVGTSGGSTPQPTLGPDTSGPKSAGSNFGPVMHGTLWLGILHRHPLEPPLSTQMITPSKSRLRKVGSQCDGGSGPAGCRHRPALAAGVPNSVELYRNWPSSGQMGSASTRSVSIPANFGARVSSAKMGKFLRTRRKVGQHRPNLGRPRASLANLGRN